MGNEGIQHFRGLLVVRDRSRSLLCSFCFLPSKVLALHGLIDWSSPDRGNLAFSDFRTGQTQLLVCTQCAEEGLDVAECCLADVVRAPWEPTIKQCYSVTTWMGIQQKAYRDRLQCSFPVELSVFAGLGLLTGLLLTSNPNSAW